MEYNADFTQKEFEDKYSFIKEEAVEGKMPSVHNCAIILGGQPGVGKSSFYDSSETLGNYVKINGDEYRRFHPRISSILKSDPEHYAERTQKFSNKVVESLISDLSDRGYDLIIEGTLRNPSTPINTCKELLRKGYTPELVVITCSAETAWKSTLSRAKFQKEHKMTPRLVPLDVYDYTVHQIPGSLDIIQKDGCFSKILIRDRDADILFSSDIDNGRVSDELRKELKLADWDRKLPEYEKDFLERKVAILSDKIKDISREKEKDDRTI